MTRLANSEFCPFFPTSTHLSPHPLQNQSQIVWEGWCQKWLRLLASNDLKWHRKLSHAPKNRHRHKMWTKVVDHNSCIKFELITINPCHLPTALGVTSKHKFYNFGCQAKGNLQGKKIITILWPAQPLPAIFFVRNNMHCGEVMG